jgi:hypothetical protein
LALGRRLAVIVASASVTMFAWGVVLALAPLLTEWPIVPRSYDVYLLVAPPASLLAGSFLMGRFTDAFGRRSGFMADMVMFSASIPLILLARGALDLIAGVALAEFSLGGDETTLLAYLAEEAPEEHRGKLLVGVTNMANVGALTASALAILTGLSVSIQRLAFVALLASVVPVIVVTRLMAPESFMWLKYRSWEMVTLSRRDYAVRLYFLITMAITVVLTYALMALVIGPYLFPRLTDWIIFIYNLGESLAGFALLPFIDSTSRRTFPFAAYLGGVVTMALFIPQYVVARGSLVAFGSLLFLNGVFGEMAWAARVVMEPELFPTRLRATGVGAVRATAYSLYVASVFFTASFNNVAYLLYNVGLWAVGLSGASLWLLKGFDTSGRPLEAISDVMAPARPSRG